MSKTQYVEEGGNGTGEPDGRMLENGTERENNKVETNTEHFAGQNKPTLDQQDDPEGQKEELPSPFLKREDQGNSDSESSLEYLEENATLAQIDGLIEKNSSEL
ncbi:uncharacterized protein MELLADRAFT_58328 [Melampsora larici-populina 98AG31]|uniref:Uncharacterized protein n=1 Tax=Melampsora larici-populina (strain 98AG31 / pathotype 3-4-7) TaxID=747676 RepID=F4R344_MELLP|nr:uncharacterized protein MELLADRAFT_58328 [Melampsora larici-populina 98AG31]EGG12563.1 hypothetical protein MELLADRAFT_58328 [Melampsora larici-populina 98AG31]